MVLYIYVGETSSTNSGEYQEEKVIHSERFKANKDLIKNSSINLIKNFYLQILYFFFFVLFLFFKNPYEELITTVLYENKNEQL